MPLAIGKFTTGFVMASLRAHDHYREYPHVHLSSVLINQTFGIGQSTALRNKCNWTDAMFYQVMLVNNYDLFLLTVAVNLSSKYRGIRTFSICSSTGQACPMQMV
jgi:hypothetical protein